MRIKRVLIFLISFFWILSCNRNEDSVLAKFENEIGEEKTEALNELMDCFYNELEQAYTDKDSIDGQINSLLNEWTGCPLALFDFYQNYKVVELMDLFEKSGLRKEILKYSCEKQIQHKDILKFFTEEEQTEILQTIESFECESGTMYEEEIVEFNISEERSKELEAEQIYRRDSTLSFNQSGLYLYSLSKVVNQNLLIKEYVSMKYVYGDLGSSAMANFFSKKLTKANKKDPLIHRIIAIELFVDYFLMMQ